MNIQSTPLTQAETFMCARIRMAAVLPRARLVLFSSFELREQSREGCIQGAFKTSHSYLVVYNTITRRN